MINPAKTIAPTNVQSGNFADLPGVRLWYVDTGAGTPLVLLHANTGTVEAWQFQIGVFAKAGWRVIAFDRRGWGKSTADPLTGDQPGTVAVMHASASEYPSDVSETDALNIELLTSTHIRPPRIASSPVQMECKLDQFIVLGKGRNTLYIGEVVAFHLSTDIYDGQRVDSVAMNPVARLGGPYYSALGEIFNRPMLQRPPGGEGWVHQPSPPDKKV